MQTKELIHNIVKDIEVWALYFKSYQLQWQQFVKNIHMLVGQDCMAGLFYLFLVMAKKIKYDGITILVKQTMMFS